MKKFTLLTQTSILILVVLMAVACGSSKDVGRNPVKIPCFGEQYYSGKGFIRASGMGESKDMMLSMKIARSNTLEALSSKISVSVQSVVNNYYSSTGSSVTEEITKKYEGITKEVVDTKINGYETECNVTNQNKDGVYQTYYCFSLPEESTLQSLYKKLSENGDLNMDYNTFINEMHKAGK